MIETIYKAENSENKKPDINIRLPKNIRQIGQGNKDMHCQIYIEENVLAYIKQNPDKESQIRYGVLLGDSKQGDGHAYIFINGLVEVDEVIEDTIIFSDEVWTSIYDNIRRYYKEGIIVGWYASFSDDASRDLSGIRKLHLDHFAGNNKVFLNINREEDEEAFHVYERNGLEKQPCYHVYFEKSVDFEDYIFGSGKKDDVQREKEPAKKENGKYGIALNNNIGSSGENNASKDNNMLNKLAKEGEKLTVGSLGKVASFITIIALAGILGVMGSNGKLDALQNKVEGFVDGILNGKSEDNNSGNIIAVDGVPKEEETVTEANAAGSNGEKASSQADAGGEIITDSNEATTTVNADGEENTTNEANSENNVTKENDSGGTGIEGNSTAVNAEPDNTTEETTDNATDKISDNTADDTTDETTTPNSARNTQATVSDINSNHASYTVKNGETLYSISVSFYGTADMINAIMELNNLTDENYVMEGQKILLP